MPTPATTLPSERSETPKSLPRPETSASTSPAPYSTTGRRRRCPGSDLNQNSIEKSSEICLVDAREVVDAVEGRRGVGVPRDRAGHAQGHATEVVAVVGALAVGQLRADPEVVEVQPVDVGHGRRGRAVEAQGDAAAPGGGDAARPSRRARCTPSTSTRMVVPVMSRPSRYVVPAVERLGPTPEPVSRAAVDDPVEDPGLARPARSGRSSRSVGGGVQPADHAGHVVGEVGARRRCRPRRCSRRWPDVAEV